MTPERKKGPGAPLARGDSATNGLFYGAHRVRMTATGKQGSHMTATAKGDA